MKFANSYKLMYGYIATNLGAYSMEQTDATTGNDASFRAKTNWRSDFSTWDLFNPCTVNDVKCKVTSTTIEPVEECAETEGGWITSFGATISPNADVNVYYIGRNGGFTSQSQLVLQNSDMVKFGKSKGKDAYIVLGFHESVTKIKSFGLSDTYATEMETAFGNHFMNLNAVIRNNAAELTYLVGVYDTIDGIYSNSDDMSYLADKDIPKSLYDPAGYFHPNPKGYDAISILIHDKMVKLGYLSDNYILSKGVNFDVIDD